MFNNSLVTDEMGWLVTIPNDSDADFYREVFREESSKLKEFVFKHNLDPSKYEPEKPLKVTLNSARFGIPIVHADLRGHIFDVRQMLIKAHIDCGYTEVPNLLMVVPPSRRQK